MRKQITCSGIMVPSSWSNIQVQIWPHHFKWPFGKNSAAYTRPTIIVAWLCDSKRWMQCSCIVIIFAASYNDIRVSNCHDAQVSNCHDIFLHLTNDVNTCRRTCPYSVLMHPRSLLITNAQCTCSELNKVSFGMQKTKMISWILLWSFVV